MSTGGKQELSYVPGDHLAVFPENREELVDTLIDLLDDAPDPDVPLRMELCKEVSGKELMYSFPASKSGRNTVSVYVGPIL